jgi:hypothetical protein
MATTSRTLQKKSFRFFLLLVYLWALFLGEATHRFLHHLQDESHHHHLSCLSEAAAQAPADEGLQRFSDRASFKTPECSLELALHVLQSQQSESTGLFAVALPFIEIPIPVYRTLRNHFHFHHFSPHGNRGSPLS